MKKVIMDCSTGQTYEQDLTVEEIAQLKADAEKSLALRQEQEIMAQAIAEAKASALAKLTALGLSEEEVKAITG